jgi:hypothetical protein
LDYLSIQRGLRQWKRYGVCLPGCYSFWAFSYRIVWRLASVTLWFITSTVDWLDRGRPVTRTSFNGVRTRASPFMSGWMLHLKIDLKANSK